MVAKNDVQMYLLSLKSFYARIKRGKVIAIIDRDLPTSSREVLLKHIPSVEFVILEDIDTGTCQRGGTWERLVYILDHTRDEYAVQLDCDTLTFGTDISEVSQCLENNIPFTLGTGGNPIVTMREAAAEARKETANYIGLVAERLFDQFPNADKLKYVRASSGFAGFAKNGFPRQSIETFHAKLAELLGARNTEWGTEQCASNFAIANSPNAVVLHRPKYANYNPANVPKNVAFLHFFGTYRYKNDFFAKRGQEVIKMLSASKAD